MAALPNVPKTVRLAVVHYSDGGSDMVSRFFIRYSGSVPSVGDLQVLVDNVVAAWAANMISAVAAASGLSRVDGVDLNSSTGAQATLADVVAGTRAGGELPADVALVASYEINRRYRGGHPRGYWPFGTESDLLDQAHWDPTPLAAFQTAVDGFFTDVVAGGWGGAGTLTHVNVSYYNGFHVVTNPVTGRARNVPLVRSSPTIDLVTATIARARLGTQRRRLGR